MFSQNSFILLLNISKEEEQSQPCFDFLVEWKYKVLQLTSDNFDVILIKKKSQDENREGMYTTMKGCLNDGCLDVEFQTQNPFFWILISYGHFDFLSTEVLFVKHKLVGQLVYRYPSGNIQTFSVCVRVMTQFTVVLLLKPYIHYFYC